jgi:hypothetical protein
MIHDITHPNPLVKSKVDFFADYFDYAVKNIGVSDLIDIENPLSLVDKILFQIENNLSHCPKYIDSYLTHPFLYEDYVDLKSETLFKHFHVEIKKYKSQLKHAKKVDWIVKNPSFKFSLIKLRRSLQRSMFKSSLQSIISYLNCKHEITEHRIDFIRLTNILVSEFLFNDRSKKDLQKMFERILSKEIWYFPFSQKLAKESKEAKETFIKNRTFQ